MSLIRPWRWFRAALLELIGVAACLLLIGISQAERTEQLNRPPAADSAASRQDCHNCEYTQPPDDELWPILGAVLEKTLN